MLYNQGVIWLCCLFTIMDVWPRTYAEIFTAISEVEPLLETHKRIIDDLDHYIYKEEQRLALLKNQLNIFKTEHDRAMEDIPNYLGNPINAFTLIKRLTTDLDFIDQSIQKGTEYIKNITMNHHASMKYPTMEDLGGAVQALTRLQETYKLKVEDLSDGILNGVMYSTPMTAGDCFELGRVLYNQKNFKDALSWMKAALKKYKDDADLYPFNEVEILEYIAFSLYMTGDTKSALEWSKKLIEKDPNHPRAAGNLPHYEKIIKEEEAELRRKRRGETGDIEEEKEIKTSGYAKERRSYEALCRGEYGISVEVAKRLKCRYINNNHPFLLLAPIKMEEMYLDPDIVVFHQVMSDEEIEIIKKMAKPKFQRAVVHDPYSGELVPAAYRISKSSWLKDSFSPVVAKISRRVEDFTGLSMASAEELQVVNYGIGGHYEPHFDFANKNEKAFANFEGNRIATVLFYMSDVSQGGATVFTKLGLSLFPIKNAAVFWMNLHASGEGNFATRHAACPVLRGSKWVSNKWIHEGGQEFRRPCTLEYQEEGLVRKILKPVPKTSR